MDRRADRSVAQPHRAGAIRSKICRQVADEMGSPAAQMVLGRGRLLAHHWVVGDENYGRPTELRDLLHKKNERYVLDVH